MDVTRLERAQVSAENGETLGLQNCMYSVTAKTVLVGWNLTLANRTASILSSVRRYNSFRMMGKLRLQLKSCKEHI